MSSRRDRWLRRMYAGGRGDATARRFARLWAVVFAIGLQPRRWVTLEVPGRTTGLPRRYPLGMADRDGRWYLVSMLGASGWVRNVRAAGGRAVLVRRHRYPVRLVEVPSESRAPILKRYLEVVPGARPHVRVDRREPVSAFEVAADDHPVFAVQPLGPGTPWDGGT